MDTFNDIARYAEGDMTAEERSAFETVLASDESLRRQLALYREVNTSLQQQFSADDRRNQLQESMQSLRSEFFGGASQPAKVIPFKRFLRGAVAVAAVLIAVVVIWQPWKASLFETFSDTSMTAPAERGASADNLLQQAVIAFNSKDYKAAAATLQQVRQQDTANSFVNFYYGVALLHTGQLALARALFNQLYAGQSAFKFEAAFFQALGYLKENDKRSCGVWLQKIPADAPGYNKAQELLKKL